MKIKSIIPLNQQEARRRQAKSLYESGQYAEVIQVFQNQPKSLLDEESLYFLSASAVYTKARETQSFLDLLMQKSEPKPEYLRLLSLWQEQNLHFNQAFETLETMFTLEYDYTQDIQRSLKLFARLGLHQKSQDMFQALDDLKVFSELFLKERIEFLADSGAFEDLEQILVRWQNWFKIHPQIRAYCLRHLACRHIQSYVDRLYLKGCMLLGPDLETSMTQSSFLEICARLKLLLQRPRLIVKTVWYIEKNAEILASTLAMALDLKFAPPQTEPALLISLGPVSESMPQSGVHFQYFLQAQDPLPQIAGVMGQVQSEFFTPEKLNPDTLLRIQHRSSLNKASFQRLKYPLFTCGGMPLFAASFGSLVPVRWLNRLKSEGPLFLQVALEELNRQELHKEELEALFHLSLAWGSLDVDVAKLIAKKDLELAFSLYQDLLSQSPWRDQAMLCLQQIPHPKTLDFLPLLEQPTASVIKQEGVCADLVKQAWEEYKKSPSSGFAYINHLNLPALSFLDEVAQSISHFTEEAKIPWMRFLLHNGYFAIIRECLDSTLLKQELRKDLAKTFASWSMHIEHRDFSFLLLDAEPELRLDLCTVFLQQGEMEYFFELSLMYQRESISLGDKLLQILFEYRPDTTLALFVYRGFLQGYLTAGQSFLFLAWCLKALRRLDEWVVFSRDRKHKEKVQELRQALAQELLYTPEQVGVYLSSFVEENPAEVVAQYLFKAEFSIDAYKSLKSVHEGLARKYLAVFSLRNREALVLSRTELKGML